MSKRQRFRVIPAEHGMALRTLVGRRLPSTTQQKAVELIKAGGVYVNQLRVRVPSVRVAKGERVTVYPGADEIEPLEPSALHFVHREPGFCVIDKPPGMPAEATKESCRGTITDALVRMLEREGIMRPYVGVFHRLDRRASGLAMFTTRGIEGEDLRTALTQQPALRTFRLLTRGGPDASVTVDQPLVRRPGGGLRLPRGAETGEPSSTRFELIERRPDRSLLEVRSESADYEVVLLHARAMGHPVVGDGDDGELSLCCVALELDHPRTGASLCFSARLPTWAAA